jgi:lipopolysaccharide/colanic/teichoic acid biosynthesis glycosyltransferase
VGNEVKKLTVRPGVTGYNQAYYRNTIEWKERLKKDNFYVENITFKLDLILFLKTIKVTLSGENIFSTDSLKIH